jgi:hypothetical protein
MRDWGHPVSGNRAFGYFTNDDGSYTFYTQGADRATAIVDHIGSFIAFNAADALWQSFQNEIVSFVTDPSRGGSAAKEQRHWERYSWPDVSGLYWSPMEDWEK